MRCKILYSHYISSSSFISNYVKSSFKFTLVREIWLGDILRRKDVLNWLILSITDIDTISEQQWVSTVANHFISEEKILSKMWLMEASWTASCSSVPLQNHPKAWHHVQYFQEGCQTYINIWIEVTRWRNTGQGSKGMCSASPLIRPTSKRWWCSFNLSYHALRNWNPDTTITTQGGNLGSCFLLCTGMPQTHENIHFKYCLRFDWQILSPLKLSDYHNFTCLGSTPLQQTATFSITSKQIMPFKRNERFHKLLQKESKRTSTYVQSKLNLLLWTGLHAFFHVTVSCRVL